MTSVLHRNLRRVRAKALPKMKGGLCALYRTLEWTRSRPLARPSQGLLLRKIPFAVSQTALVPGANPLKDAHAALDTAVPTAYGFSAKKDLLAQLLDLNQAVAVKIEKAETVISPGVPENCPDAKTLVAEGCIREVPRTKTD